MEKAVEEAVCMWGYRLLPELQHFIINHDSFNHLVLQQVYTCMKDDDDLYGFILDHSNPFNEDELRRKAAKILLLHNQYHHFNSVFNSTSPLEKPTPCKVYPDFKVLDITTIEQCRLDTECDLISISKGDNNKVLPLTVDTHSYMNVWCYAHFNPVPFPSNSLFCLTLAATIQQEAIRSEKILKELEEDHWEEQHGDDAEELLFQVDKETLAKFSPQWWKKQFPHGIRKFLNKRSERRKKHLEEKLSDLKIVP